MQPKIKTAHRQIDFNLPGDYTATVLTDVQSLGIMQYLHMLIIFGADEQPCLFVCAEWFDPHTLSEYGPVLGVFSSNGHANLGTAVEWGDVSLFVLQAVDLARRKLALPDNGMTEGEAWAMLQVLKNFTVCESDVKLTKFKAGYLDALSRNDGRLVEYMKRSQ